MYVVPIHANFIFIFTNIDFFHVSEIAKREDKCSLREDGNA